MPAPGGNNDGDKGNQGDNKDTEGPKLPTGTLFSDRSDFVKQMQAAGCTIVKEVTPSAPGEKYTALLVCLAQPEDPWRVLIEAKDDILLRPGHFMGRAGHGSFVVWKNTEALPDGMSNSWVFNRCSEYKKDIAVRANGMWVLASGEPASGGTKPPNMRTLEDIQKELGDSFQTLWAHTITRGARGVRVAPAHSSAHVMWIPTLVKLEDGPGEFTMDCLNRFAPSWEVRDGEAGLECSGFLRPAFEVSLDGNQLAPGKQVGEADRSKNPACLFLRKTIKLKKSQMIVL